MKQTLQISAVEMTCTDTIKLKLASHFIATFIFFENNTDSTFDSSFAWIAPTW